MRHRQKIILYIFLAILIIAGGLFLLFAYSDTTLKTDSVELSTPASKKPLAGEFIQFDKRISSCEERGLKNKILLIVYKNCRHCKVAASRLLPLVKKYHLEKYFRILDTDNEDDLRAMDELGIVVPYVPVLIIDCEAYLGLRGNDQYDNALGEFYNKTKANDK
jgi:hypothetical protein